MARVRRDNDARYALRASFVDENGDVITGDTITIGGSSDDSRISDTDIANWNTAYGWGDHSTEGYLVATPTDKANWNTAHGWGDHGAAGYAVENASATFTEVVLGDWKIVLSGTDLRFNYNGTDVFKIQSSGALASISDVTANATL